MSELTVVYTDGACKGNPGRGGWAWIVPNGAFASGVERRSTNERMEVQAVLEALRCIDGPVRIESDSRYVVDCFNKKWYVEWHKRGWVNTKKLPVANRGPLGTASGPLPRAWWTGHIRVDARALRRLLEWAR